MAGASIFMPEFRPGELLYSVFARHARWTAPAGPKAAMKALLGDGYAVASIDLPNRLGALEGRLPGILTVDAMIQRHTLAPYYTAFLPAETRQAVLHGMRGAGGDLHLISGVSAFRVGRVTRLRFCPDCFEEMLERWGSFHWRRDHQLPSVLVCPTHGTVLRMSAADLVASNRHGFIAATDATCPASSEPVIRMLSAADHDMLFRLANASVALLEGSGSIEGLDDLPGFYRRRLRQVGLMQSRKKVDQKALEEAFMERYGRIIARFPGLSSPDGLQGNWLAGLTTKRVKASHPLMHLLMRDFLDALPARDDACGDGPWPCRNPLAEHYDQDVVTDLRTYRNRDAEVAVYSCHCGYSYTRSVSPDGVLGPPRFKEFGPLLRPALQTMVQNGMSLRAIGSHLGLDPKTVVTLAARHGIDTPWKLKPSARSPIPAEPPEKPVQKLRPRRSLARRRCDWRSIDLRLAGEVKSATTRIRSVSPPARVTATAIERELVGRRGWIGKRRHKLPRTCSAISSRAEPLGSFQLRRIDYWIAHEAEAADSVRAWRVMRHAGLRSDALPLIEQRIEEKMAASEFRLSA